MSKRRGLCELFRWPSLIALVSVIGLLSALISDGLGDALSWTLLAVPVAVVWFKWRSA